MDPDRPHRSSSINNSSSSSNTASTTSELFICFTSRLSSSSMKISSKSILSPGRIREPSQISLSSSLSRRLKSNGSMKGGQASPMFPTNGKKRGCAFENPEPSSPKVTCIGQVRVKTKKQGKKFRACRSKRRGEVSFRKVDHNNVNNGGSNGLDSSSCQDYNMGHFLSNNSHHQQQQECKKWVHLPLTICEALRSFGAEFNCFLPCRSSCMANQRDKEEKNGGSVGANNGNGHGNGSSSCGAVFARWLVAVQEGEEEGKEREIELVVGGGEDDERRESRDEAEVVGESLGRRNLEEETIIECQYQEQENEVEIEIDQQESAMKEEILAEVSSDLEKLQGEENAPEIEQEHENGLEDELQQQGEEEAEAEAEENVSGKVEEEGEDQALVEGAEEEEEEEEEESSTIEEEEAERSKERSELECPQKRESDPEDESKESESQQNLLPDCLLLMMCEPKLSMEVSKETWVCSTDFIRWVPEKKKQPVVKQKDGGDETKRRISIDSNPAPVLLQPRRSSCSFPAAPPMATVAAAKGAGGGGSMANMKEQKLVGGKGYEPFVLKRCKSEPRRSSVKLAPDACFWKNRKLEPTTLGVGAAGVGF
ncbi:hypothetical protein REPUB_Repub11eG0051400 [Reevesia pubescens]